MYANVVSQNSDLLYIDGEYGVSNIATIVVYLLSMVKGILAFVTIKGGKWIALSLLIQPIKTIQAVSLAYTAITEIIKALPSAIKESLDLSSNELNTLINLILLGLKHVNEQP